ncbi:hypothetical protein [Microbacterium dextranolyticum]|uniref:Uncharacterized protein n=1 Tax=Microbacterium dextranolyticum TaxID=36806 RepID=A0A9W6HM33_9MICO|nr:hypothetical protein [Microbacterium dextranolyticum]MBM7464340.1 hypothetical protein [Microbacterium dextranolyticum]GLJ95337.1 hypothetical protein GCM10017591_13990 [Microbacterium dextranolyticum]
MSNDERPIDPAEMLQVMQSTRRATRGRMARVTSWLLFVWAVAWFVGFGALWLGDGVGGVPLIPAPIAWTAFGALTIAAVVSSGVMAVWMSSGGIRGRSQLRGKLYGYSWMVSMFAVTFLLQALRLAGFTAELAQLIYPAFYIFTVGLMYLAGGAIWRSPAQFILGVIMLVVVVIATFAGAPWHYLIYATVGPAAMTVTGALLWRGILPADERTAPVSS